MVVPRQVLVGVAPLSSNRCNDISIQQAFRQLKIITGSHVKKGKQLVFFLFRYYGIKGSRDQGIKGTWHTRGKGHENKCIITVGSIRSLSPRTCTYPRHSHRVFVLSGALWLAVDPWLARCGHLTTYICNYIAVRSERAEGSDCLLCNSAVVNGRLGGVWGCFRTWHVIVGTSRQLNVLLYCTIQYYLGWLLACLLAYYRTHFVVGLKFRSVY